MTRLSWRPLLLVKQIAGCLLWGIEQVNDDPVVRMLVNGTDYEMGIPLPRAAKETAPARGELRPPLDGVPVRPGTIC